MRFCLFLVTDLIYLFMREFRLLMCARMCVYIYKYIYIFHSTITEGPTLFKNNSRDVTIFMA